MLEIDPEKRLSAKEALNHPWFTLEHIGSNILSIAQENVRKHCSDKYFNLEKKKPEFSSAFRTPNLRYSDTGKKLNFNPFISNRKSSKNIDHAALFQGKERSNVNNLIILGYTLHFI